MDLVDIDQVLDNLELREAADEHNRSISALITTTAQNDAESSNHPSKGDNGCALVSLNSSTHKSGFVGVSQVFNSLDDYQKNVESLETAPAQRYDEECRLISDVAKPKQDLEMISNENEFVDGVISDNLATNQMQENTFNNDMVVKTIDARSDSSIAHSKLYEVDAEDEEEASDDLHKFTENNRHLRRVGYEENEIGDNSPLSSDSLTTSSSSTFSSGPSPGIVSTTDEHSAPLTPDEECASEDRDALLPVHPNVTEPDDEDDEEQGAMTDEEIVDDGKESDLLSAPQVESTGGIEDIAVGLSSISLATGNSQLNLPTVSSVLQNVLEDLSETTSNSPLSQQRETGQIENSEVSCVTLFLC